MKEETESVFVNMEELIKKTFLECLEAAKDVQPNTPEWEFVWSALYAFKTYAEEKDDHRLRK